MSHSLVLTHVQTDAGNRFLFIRTTLEGIKEIRAAKLLRKILDFEQFGTILLSGEGTPDQSVRDYIESSYGTFVEL